MGILDKFKFWKKEDDLDFDHLVDKSMQEGAPKEDLLGTKGFPEEKPTFSEEEAPGTTGKFALPPHLEEPGMSASKTAGYPQFSTSTGTGRNPDLELLNSKLDTIKAMLNSLEQRLTNIEKATGAEQRQRLW